MKFRATFGSPGQLSRLVVLLDKMADSCVVHLTPDLISFAVPMSTSSGVQVAADLAQRSIFLDHRIQSLAENNRISFFVKLDNLSRALKSCSHTQTQKTQVKLTKKMNGGPTLTFEILLSDSQVQVLHDVPIRIVQDPAELYGYAEPEYPKGTTAVSVVLPQNDVRGLKNVTERMRLFSDYLQLSATEMAEGARPGSKNAAQLQLQVEKDNLVTITTTYRNLEIAQVDPGDDSAFTGTDGLDPDGDGGAATVKLELKKVCRALSSLVASDIKMYAAICCLVPRRAVVLKVTLPSPDEIQSNVVFYFPAQL